jgi:protease-4
MTFASKAWKILVGVKDALVLLLMLLFFWGLYAVLTARPSPAQVHEGALYLPLEGRIVEEKARAAPLAMILSGQRPAGDIRTRDLVHALETAAGASRVKAVASDLEQFGGGGLVSLQRIGAAMDKVRAANKPVLVRSPVYTDGRMLLAAHASEIWVDPIGGAMITGPGGSQLYYKGLLDRLKIQAHVFRVGTYKSAVEPFERADASPEARESVREVYAAVWNAWQADVKKARPRANIAMVTGDPAAWLAASGGDAAKAAQAAGLVDRIGDKVAFGQRVAELAGPEPGKPAGTFRHTGLAAWLAANPVDDGGKGIAVVTIANEIVDGRAGPGVAGGDRIADLIDEAAAQDYPALVVRVDSPGGSVTGSERIRAAIERFRAKGRPVVVSMGNYAASGGYWVATPAQRIFAEPATITGSIGIFGVIPTFEKTLADYGVTTDGLRTTPLSGQPDVLAGLTPEAKGLIQQQIEQNYARFLGLVAKSRGKTPQEIDRVAQGRVWDGGTARQLGLVDQFGGIEDALAWAAGQAKLDKWHADYLGAGDDAFGDTLTALLGGGDADADTGAGEARVTDLTSFAALRQQAVMARLGADLARLTSGQGAQAWCLECAGLIDAPVPARNEAGWLAVLLMVLR